MLAVPQERSLLKTTAAPVSKTSSDSYIFDLSPLVQVVPPLAVLVPVLPIFVLHAQTVNLHLRANASLLVLRIHFPLPVPVLNVILTARLVPERPSTNAAPAHLPVPSS